MDKSLRRILILVLGWAFLILGVIGLFLPVLQGVLFIVIGLYILSHESELAAALLRRLKRRYPELTLKAEKVKVKLERRLKGLRRRRNY